MIWMAVTAFSVYVETLRASGRTELTNAELATVDPRVKSPAQLIYILR